MTKTRKEQQSVRPAFVLTTQPDVHDPTVEAAWMDCADGETQPVVSWAWTGQAGIEIGDLIAVYVAAPHSGICWLGRAISGAYADPARTERLRKAEYWFWLEMTPLANPVTLADMKANPHLAEWGPVTQRFQARSRKVAADGPWEELLRLAITKNPEVAAVLDEWASSEPEPYVDPAMGTYVWEPAIGTPFPFLVERDMQSALHEAALSSEFIEPRQMSTPLDLPSFEPVLAPGSRADLLFGLPDEDGEPTMWTLWETKLLANRSAVEQIVRYCDLLAGMRPDDLVNPRVIAFAFSREALLLADQESVECWRVRWATEDEAMVENARPDINADGSSTAERTTTDGRPIRRYPVMLERLEYNGSAAKDPPPTAFLYVSEALGEDRTG